MGLHSDQELGVCVLHVYVWGTIIICLTPVLQRFIKKYSQLPHGCLNVVDTGGWIPKLGVEK